MGSTMGRLRLDSLHFFAGHVRTSGTWRQGGGGKSDFPFRLVLQEAGEYVHARSKKKLLRACGKCGSNQSGGGVSSYSLQEDVSQTNTTTAEGRRLWERGRKLGA